MKIISAIVGAAAVLAASSVTGTAADLYGGRGSIKDDYIPAQASACGACCNSWYARVDGGYSSLDRPSITQYGVDDLLRPSAKDTWSVGGGFGRYFTCNIRADVTYDHRFSSDVAGFNGNQFSPGYGDQKFKMSNDVVLFNAYYDFDLRSRFTPYVGVGLGFTYNQIGRGTGIGYGTGDALSSAGNSNWHAAAALMTGFSLALRDRLALDAGYRFLYLGNAKSGDVIDTVTGGNAGPNAINELHAHEFRVGLRYALGGSSDCCNQPMPLK